VVQSDLKDRAVVGLIPEGELHIICRLHTLRPLLARFVKNLPDDQIAYDLNHIWKNIHQDNPEKNIINRINYKKASRGSI
tara:strand:+ start:510 stop:749 length:240 start_codon:yes stop_codon:yes gene_type:complete